MPPKRSVLWGVTHLAEPRGRNTGAWSSENQKTCHSAQSPHDCSVDTETRAHLTQTTRNHVSDSRPLGSGWPAGPGPRHTGVCSRVSANARCVTMTPILPPRSLSCFCPQEVPHRGHGWRGGSVTMTWTSMSCQGCSSLTHLETHFRVNMRTEQV